MSHVRVIQNVSTKQVLTWNGSSVTMHMNTTDASKYTCIVNNTACCRPTYVWLYIWEELIVSLTEFHYFQITSIWHIKVVPLLNLTITFRGSMTTTRSFNQPMEAPQFASNLSLQAVLTPFGWQNLVLVVIHNLELSCSLWMEGISGTWEHMHLETQQSWSVLIIWTMWVHAYMIIYL